MGCNFVSYGLCKRKIDVLLTSKKRPPSLWMWKTSHKAESVADLRCFLSGEVIKLVKAASGICMTLNNSGNLFLRVYKTCVDECL